MSNEIEVRGRRAVWLTLWFSLTDFHHLHFHLPLLIQGRWCAVTTRVRAESHAKFLFVEIAPVVLYWPFTPLHFHFLFFQPVNGVRACGDEYSQNKILKTELNFQGAIVSEWVSSFEPSSWLLNSDWLAHPFFSPFSTYLTLTSSAGEWVCSEQLLDSSLLLLWLTLSSRLFFLALQGTWNTIDDDNGGLDVSMHGTDYNGLFGEFFGDELVDAVKNGYV